MGTDDSAAAAPTGARPRRRKRGAGRKPAGSRWINYLLALGCLASLFPLWWEYRHGGRDAMPQPHHNDPWVRVIDAVEEGQRSQANTASSAKLRRWRHHPRHQRNHTLASVRADGGINEDGEEEEEDADVAPTAVPPIRAGGALPSAFGAAEPRIVGAGTEHTQPYDTPGAAATADAGSRGAAIQPNVSVGIGLGDGGAVSTAGAAGVTTAAANQSTASAHPVAAGTASSSTVEADEEVRTRTRPPALRLPPPPPPALIPPHPRTPTPAPQPSSRTFGMRIVGRTGLRPRGGTPADPASAQTAPTAAPRNLVRLSAARTGCGAWCLAVCTTSWRVSARIRQPTP